MAQPIQIQTFTPTDDTRLGRMLAGGRLTATMASKKSGQHITLTLHCMAKSEGQWKHVTFEQASHVFIKQGDGKWGSGKVGTFYPKNGKLYFDTQDKAWQYAATHTLGAAHHGTQDTANFEISEASRCGCCGKELTNDTSIALGIGPDCEEKYFGTSTPRSQHYKAQPAARQAAAAPDESVRDVAPSLAPVAESRPVKDKKGRPVPRTFEALAAAVNG